VEDLVRLRVTLGVGCALFLDQQNSDNHVFEYILATMVTRKQVGWATRETESVLVVYDRKKKEIWRGPLTVVVLESGWDIERGLMRLYEWVKCEEEDDKLALDPVDDFYTIIPVRERVSLQPRTKQLPQKPLPKVPSSAEPPSLLKKSPNKTPNREIDL
jgi:hypothetical protein